MKLRHFSLALKHFVAAGWIDIEKCFKYGSFD